MQYQGGMDPECIQLCDAINLLNPDIYTIESCCGHGKKEYRIFIKVENLKNLPILLYFIDS